MPSPYVEYSHQPQQGQPEPTLLTNSTIAEGWSPGEPYPHGPNRFRIRLPPTTWGAAAWTRPQIFAPILC